MRQRYRPEDHPQKLMRFRMPDATGDVLHATLNRPEEPAGNLPLAVLVHGLTGCVESHYMRATAAVLLRRGMRVLRVNLRGRDRRARSARSSTTPAGRRTCGACWRRSPSR